MNCVLSGDTVTFVKAKPDTTQITLCSDVPISIQGMTIGSNSFSDDVSFNANSGSTNRVTFNVPVDFKSDVTLGKDPVQGLDMGELSDVNLTSTLASGSLLTYNGSRWTDNSSNFDVTASSITSSNPITPVNISPACKVNGLLKVSALGHMNSSLTLPVVADVDGTLSVQQINNSHVAPDAAISDTKLDIIQTANKVANTATTATSLNIGNTIVCRDSNGSFTANNITSNHLYAPSIDPSTGSSVTLSSQYVFDTSKATWNNYGTGLLHVLADHSLASSGVIFGDLDTSIYSKNATGSTIVQRDTDGSLTATSINATSINFAFETFHMINTGAEVGNQFISRLGKNTFIGQTSGPATSEYLGGLESNTSVGGGTLLSLTTGSNNTILGADAVQNITTGSNNTILGYGSGVLTNGSDNIFIGMNAGDSCTGVESSNILIGNAGVGGESNAIRIGTSTNQNKIVMLDGPTMTQTNLTIPNVSLSGSIIVSSSNSTAMQTDDNSRLFTFGGTDATKQNLFIGKNAGPSSISVMEGWGNVGIGSGTMAKCCDLAFPKDCTAMGSAALANYTGPGNNTVYGSQAAVNLIMGFNNVLVGSNVGINYQNSETNNVILGNNAGVTGENNVVRLGASSNTITYFMDGPSLTSTTFTVPNIAMSGKLSFSGNSNTQIVDFDNAPFIIAGTNASGNQFIGKLSGGTSASSISMGDWNLTAMGFSAMGSLANTGVAKESVAIGSYALGAWQSGYSNTAVGKGSLNSVLTGLNNTAIGSYAGSSYTSNESNNISIGNLCGGVVGESNVTRIGEGQTSAYFSGIYGVGSTSGNQVYVSSTGQLMAPSSSRRYKNTIVSVTEQQANIIDKLRPVTYFYNTDASHLSSESGLIAEEVAAIDSKLVTYKQCSDGIIKPDNVRYNFLLNGLLIKRVQMLIQEVARLSSIVTNTNAPERVTSETNLIHEPLQPTLPTYNQSMTGHVIVASNVKSQLTNEGDVLCFMKPAQQGQLFYGIRHCNTYYEAVLPLVAKGSF